MPTDSVRCRVDILVVEGQLERALKRLLRASGDVRGALHRRRRDGAKPSVKRRAKRFFGRNPLAWYRREWVDDERRRARRAEQRQVNRAALQWAAAAAERRERSRPTAARIAEARRIAKRAIDEGLA